MITLIRSCRCTRYFLEIPDQELGEFKEQFQKIFPDGKVDSNGIVSINIKDEEEFNNFLQKLNQKTE